MIIVKFLGLAVLAAMVAVVGFVGDAFWNDSRMFYAALGRDALIHQCIPLTKERLIGQGFTPTDLTFGPRPSIDVAASSLGRSKTLQGDFTFSDGPDGQRIDGALICVVSGKTVTVDVRVDTLPRRAA